MNERADLLDRYRRWERRRAAIGRLEEIRGSIPSRHWHASDDAAVDLMHDALALIAAPDWRNVVDRIHEAMAWPFQWSADTPEAVADILTSVGYTFPDEGVFDDDEEPDFDQLAPWRPPNA